MCINICLMEAIYNGITHGYKGAGKQNMILDIKIDKTDHSFKMIVRDHGTNKWFQNYTFPPVMEYTTPPTHGIGLMMLKLLSDSLKITNTAKTGTLVEIKFNIK